jgi:hypothetical protein
MVDRNFLKPLDRVSSSWFTNRISSRLPDPIGCGGGNIVEKCAKPTSPNFKDLTGQRFHRLLVLEYQGQGKRSESLWLCKCDCGTERVFAGFSVTSGDKKSCGCQQHRKNMRIEVQGKAQTINEWSSELGVPANTLYKRLRNHWPIERAFSKAK